MKLHCLCGRESTSDVMSRIMRVFSLSDAFRYHLARRVLPWRLTSRTDSICRHHIQKSERSVLHAQPQRHAPWRRQSLRRSHVVHCPTSSMWHTFTDVRHTNMVCETLSDNLKFYFGQSPRGSCQSEAKIVGMSSWLIPSRQVSERCCSCCDLPHRLTLCTSAAPPPHD
jgi:hypothetical protein